MNTPGQTLIFGDMPHALRLKAFCLRSLIRGDGMHWDRYEITRAPAVFEMRPTDIDIVEGLL